MRTLLAVLARRGVPRAGAAKDWPVDVVTQVMRDNAGLWLPIRDRMDGHAARSVARKIEKAATGLWKYETRTTKDVLHGHTVYARATLAVDGGMRVPPPRKTNTSFTEDDDVQFPNLLGTEDTEGR